MPYEQINESRYFFFRYVHTCAWPLNRHRKLIKVTSLIKLK